MVFVYLLDHALAFRDSTRGIPGDRLFTETTTRKQALRIAKAKSAWCDLMLSQLIIHQIVNADHPPMKAKRMKSISSSVSIVSMRVLLLSVIPSLSMAVLWIRYLLLSICK